MSNPELIKLRFLNDNIMGFHNEHIAQTIDEGLDVNYPDPDHYNRTPLMLAARYGNVAAISILIEKGADRNAEDEKGFTVLHHACDGINPHVFTVGFFCELGVSNLDHQDYSGNTPLFWAVFNLFEDYKQGLSDVVVFLLEKGADPHIKNIQNDESPWDLLKLYRNMSGGSRWEGLASPELDRKYEELLTQENRVELERETGSASILISRRPRV